jgi:serine/threonine-protein kinase
MRYERLLALGSGGMANVDLALAIGQGGFNRLVVVKSMHQGFLAQPEVREMFLGEARLCARLNHPNVVQVSEVVEAPTGPVLVMEYLDGLSLSAAYRTAGDAFTLPMRLRAICEILAGLHYAHELADYQGSPLGIVHRDVSPQNVFLTYNGQVKLLDFGIAKATSWGDQTQSGVVKGRLAYMPAEQLASGRVDRRTDIYAVGCLLWEAIAGGRIWENRSDRDMMRSVLAGKLPSLRARVDALDPALEAIVARATDPQPDARYASADAMGFALEEFLGSSSSRVTTREIGALLSRLCRETREQRQRAIREAISRVDATLTDLEGCALDSASSIRRARPHRERSLDASLWTHPPSSLPSAFASGSSAAGTPSATPARASRAWHWAAGFTLLAAASGVVWFRSRAPAPLPAASAAAVIAATTTAAPSVVRTYRLTVEVSPPDARVFVDGQLVPGIPAVAEVTANTEHRLRVEREGREASERQLRVSDDTVVSMVLPQLVEAKAREPKASALRAREPKASGLRAREPKLRKSVATRASPPVLAPAPSALENANCDPPYYFTDGIKNYKPGCI